MQVFDTPELIDCFAITVVASAIKLYRKTGMKANRAYTPTNMLAFASKHTGKKYKRSELETAENDLRALVAAARS